MALIIPTCLKAQITASAIFVQRGKKARERQTFVCWENKERSYSASCAGCWKDKLMRKCHEMSHKGTIPMVLHLVTRNHLHFQSSLVLGEAQWSVHPHHHLQGTCTDIQLPWRGSLVPFYTPQDIPLNFQLSILDLFNYPRYSHKTRRYDIGPVEKLRPPGGAAGRQMCYVREQNYTKCLCLDIWTKQGEISGPINLVLALQHHTSTGSVWTFPTRHSLKVAKHGGIRQEQSSELKSVFCSQAVPRCNCLVILFLGRRRKNCTGIWNKMAFSVKGVHFRSGSLWHRAGLSTTGVSGLAKLEFLCGRR